MKHFAILSIAILLLTACTKEQARESQPPPVPNPPADTASFHQFSMTAARFAAGARYIRREVTFNATNPALKSVREFSYDAANRCTTILLGTIDSAAASPQFRLSQTLTFNYEGAALLPSSLASVRTVFPNLVTTFYYKYNSAGLKIMDSVRVKNSAGDPADRKVVYVYEKGRVYTTPVLVGFPMDNNGLDTLELLNGGNIEKLVSHIVNTTTGDRLVTYSFSYDNRVSPYNQLNISNSLYFENASIGLGYNVPLELHYQGVTTNNMTAWSTGGYTVTYRYQYDGSNYPVKREQFLPGNTAPSQTTYYQY